MLSLNYLQACFLITLSFFFGEGERQNGIGMVSILDVVWS